MKKILILLLSCYALNSTAQSKEHLTGIPDTSFSISKDFEKNLPKYPFIKIVPDSVTAGVAESRNLVYCQIGNRQLHIDAFTPAHKTSKALPAVLIVHGGGWRSGNHTQHIPLAQRLAMLGYASFTVEYRLSTEALYPAAVNDLTNALQWLHSESRRFNIDTNKIAILGFSAGGQLAALVGVTTGTGKFDQQVCNQGHSGRVQAVIDIDGTLSFVHPDAWETKNKENLGPSAWWLGYARTEHIDVWTEASPFTYTDDNTVPFLFLQSSVERMHTGHTEFKNAMDKKGIYTRIIDFGDTPHTFCLYYPWFSPMLESIHSFLKKVFK